jgi:hypothetical protein
MDRGLKKEDLGNIDLGFTFEVGGGYRRVRSGVSFHRVQQPGFVYV